MNSQSRSQGSFFLTSSAEGCTTNLYESSSYIKYLTGLGLDRAKNAIDAEYIIINTCGYNKNMQDKSSEIILEMKRKYGEDKKIIVGGCFPQMNIKNFIKDLDLPVFFPGDTHEMHDRLKLNLEKIEIQETSNFDVSDKINLSFVHKLIFKIRNIYLKFENLFGRKFQPLHNLIDAGLINNSYTPILTGVGCLGSCTYCAIKIVKGNIKSRPLEVIESAFNKSLKKGNNKIWLLGDDIGCWGQDIGLDSSILLERLLNRKDSFKLVITYYDPRWLEKYYEKLEEIWKDRRIVGVCFSIQSGSNNILKEMQRKYYIESVLEKISRIKKNNPDLGVKTNLIVGFPGETWGDYFQSVKALFYFDAIVVNMYGQVGNTIAANKKNQISSFVKYVRYYLMGILISIRHLQVALKSFLSI